MSDTLPSRSDHPLYATWRRMFDGKKRSDVKICKAWMFSFETFAKDVGEIPDTAETYLKLDRLDYLKEWGPGNVDWFSGNPGIKHARMEGIRLLAFEMGKPVPVHVPPTRRMSDKVTVGAQGVDYFLVKQSVVRKRMDRLAKLRQNTQGKPLLTFEYRGEQLSVTQLAKLANVAMSTMRSRLVDCEWPAEKAVNHPVRKWGHGPRKGWRK